MPEKIADFIMVNTMIATMNWAAILDASLAAQLFQKAYDEGQGLIRHIFHMDAYDARFSEELIAAMENSARPTLRFDSIEQEMSCTKCKAKETLEDIDADVEKFFSPHFTEDAVMWQCSECNTATWFTVEELQEW